MKKVFYFTAPTRLFQLMMHDRRDLDFSVLVRLKRIEQEFQEIEEVVKLQNKRRLKKRVFEYSFFPKKPSNTMFLHFNLYLFCKNLLT